MTCDKCKCETHKLFKVENGVFFCRDCKEHRESGHGLIFKGAGWARDGYAKLEKV
jgi:hypothetical protein